MFLNKKALSHIQILAIVVLIIVVTIGGFYFGTRVGPASLSPSPSSTLSPTSTPAPKSNIEFLSYSYYFNSEGYIYIVGEVKNNLMTNVKFVRIIATFYNSSDKVIDTAYGYTNIMILNPSKRSPFILTTYPNKISPTKYKLTVEYRTTEEETYNGLVILNYTSSFNELGYHQIIGEVINNGNRRSTFVKVVCTYYDSDNIVIGMSFAYTDPDNINSGEKAPFELSAYDRDLHPDHYELQVVGQ